MFILQSPHRSFQVSKLCKSVAICEAFAGERFNWNKDTKNQPAFLVYLGCSQEEVSGYIKTFNTFYHCYWCEICQPNYLKEFEAEIKVRGMQRKSDRNAVGLDNLIQSEQAKHFSCDYTTGVMQNY
jgi:hypothetical protein